MLTSVNISPESTLIILDEIQSAPKALTALKYFYEDAPEYVVAAAGSLLGITTASGSGYPVGKVQTLNLYPLSFFEFLDATGNQTLRQMIENGDVKSINVFADKEIKALKQFYFVGGMPEVVANFAQTEDYLTARTAQLQILEDYQRDFAKHAPNRALPRMFEAWKSIPAHLSQENKKYVFGRIRKGARAVDF